MAPLQFHAQSASKTFRFAAILFGVLLTSTFAATVSTNEANASPAALLASHSAPPAGLSVEAKDAAFQKGFEFKFKSDTSTTQMTLDPLGNRHTASGSIGSKAGTISLSGKYSPNDREITITAKRAGQEIGEFTWRVEAVLR
jgi:hypothetical protein